MALDLSALEAAITEHVRISGIMADLAKMKAAAADEIERLKQQSDAALAAAQADSSAALAPAAEAVDALTAKITAMTAAVTAEYQAITGQAVPAVDPSVPASA